MFDLMPWGRKRDFLDAFFDRDLMREFPGFAGFNLDFRADIKETATHYIIEAELPGISKEQIVVELKDNTLTISAEQNEEAEQQEANYVRRERRQGRIRRSFYVDNIDSKSVKADYTDGVLKVWLPKINKDSGHQRIKIN